MLKSLLAASSGVLEGRIFQDTELKIGVEDVRSWVMAG